MLKIYNIIFLIFFFLNSAIADVIKIFEFTETEISQLQVRKVRGADNKTIYTVESNKNGNFLKAIAINAASGLGKEIKINLNKTPFINITWKVEKDLQGIKEDTKKGHDFAARVFVIKKQVQHLSLIEQLITFFLAIMWLDLTHQVHIQKNL